MFQSMAAQDDVRLHCFEVFREFVKFLLAHALTSYPSVNINVPSFHILCPHKSHNVLLSFPAFCEWGNHFKSQFHVFNAKAEGF
jgi:hypothetical protein